MWIKKIKLIFKEWIDIKIYNLQNSWSFCPSQSFDYSVNNNVFYDASETCLNCTSDGENRFSYDKINMHNQQWT